MRVEHCAKLRTLSSLVGGSENTLSPFRTLQVCLVIAGFLTHIFAQPTLDARYLDESEPERVALIIGNRKYSHWSWLESSVADADRMRYELADLGFDVESFYLDVRNVHQFQYEVLPAFRRKINPGAFVIVYFSGHGFAHGPHNMLAPTELPLEIAENDVSDYAISVEALQDLIATHSPGMTVFFLDACRSFAGFKIKNSEGERLIPKGPSEPNLITTSSNVIFGFASRPGQTANGSTEPGRLSSFTSILVEHIGSEGRPFSTVFDDIAARVAILTGDKQDPGFYDWSKTDPYFKPTDQVRAQQREAWYSALSSNVYEVIDHFSRLHSVSRHAKASRRWLAENIASRSKGFTQASPIAIDRAWQNTNADLASVVRLGGPIGYSRSIDADQVQSLESKTDSEIGVVNSTVPKFTISQQRTHFSKSLLAHERVILTQDVRAVTIDESLNAKAISLQKGTMLDICEVGVDASKVTITASTLQNTTCGITLNVLPAASALNLGYSIKEIVAPPRPEGINDLVDQNTIITAVNELMASGHQITWVSLATGRTNDPDTASLRAARMANAAYILQTLNIQGIRITSVAGRDDFTGDGVRLRFFGTK